MRVVESKNGSMARYVSMVRYASIFAKKYDTLVRYAFFGIVRVRNDYDDTLVWYALKIKLRYGTLVRYGSRWKVRCTQILYVPYCTAILATDIKTDWHLKLSRKKIWFFRGPFGGPRGGGTPKLCQNICLLNIYSYQNKLAP